MVEKKFGKIKGKANCYIHWQTPWFSRICYPNRTNYRTIQENYMISWEIHQKIVEEISSPPKKSSTG